MAKITITKEDLLRSKVLEPGWYKAKVKRTVESTAKTDQSVIFTVEMVVVSGPTQKDGSSPAAVPLQRTYSEKAPGFAVKFFQALGAKIDPEKGATLDFAAADGREIGVYIKNDLYKGVLRNVAEDFQPI